jgi:hypothetical protein
MCQDGTGDKRKVLDLYRKGAQLLKQGIAINFESDPDCKRYEELRLKMQTNLTLVNDRLSALGKLFLFIFCPSLETPSFLPSHTLIITNRH